MKLKLLTSQIKFDIEIWNLTQIQIKSWHSDLKFESNSNFWHVKKFELDSNSNSNRDFQFANRIKSTHSSLKLDSTISLVSINVLRNRLKIFNVSLIKKMWIFENLLRFRFWFRLRLRIFFRNFCDFFNITIKNSAILLKCLMNRR